MLIPLLFVAGGSFILSLFTGNEEKTETQTVTVQTKVSVTDENGNVQGRANETIIELKEDEKIVLIVESEPENIELDVTTQTDTPPAEEMPAEEMPEIETPAEETEIEKNETNNDHEFR